MSSSSTPLRRSVLKQSLPLISSKFTGWTESTNGRRADRLGCTGSGYLEIPRLGDGASRIFNLPSSYRRSNQLRHKLVKLQSQKLFY